MVAQMDSLYIKTRPVKAVSRLMSYALFEGRPLVTKGRWINPLVFALFNLEKRLPQSKRVEKPIFILGTGRSGTTILGIVMSMHKQIGFLNEPKALWHAIYPYEDVIGSYSRGVGHYRLGAQEATDAVCQSAHRLFGAYLTAVASRRVLDKYPELIFRVPFVRAIFPDARFIFLVRNGWDTCRSIEQWSSREGMAVEQETHDWWGANNRKWNLLLEQVVRTDPAFAGIVEQVAKMTDHKDMAIVEWIAVMRQGQRLLNELPDCVHMVRYEDMVSKPEASLAELLKFCELPPDEKFLSYARQTLSPASPKPPFPVHLVLQPLFAETMIAMGYNV